MTIKEIIEPFAFENRFWVKYSIITNEGKQEIRSVSYRTMDEAKEYFNTLSSRSKLTTTALKMVKERYQPNVGKILPLK